MTENIPVPTGELRIKTIDAATGKTLSDVTTKNLVVSIGRTSMCKLLGDAANNANRSLKAVGVGTGNAATTVGDTDLTSGFYKAITTANITYPTATSIKVSFVIDNSEANGLVITEWGLFSGGATPAASRFLYSRAVRPSITKNSSIALQCDWTLTF